jgi:hypothetical protein
MKSKIKKSYRRASDLKTLGVGDRVSDSLKGNAKFPDVEAKRTKLEKTNNDFRGAISIAGRKDRTLSSAKNDIRAELIRVLDDLADYVTTISNGDKTMLLSSGFDITGQKDLTQVLAPIEKLVVVSEMPGQATTRVKRVAGARSYVHQYTTDPLSPDSVWVSETTTDREHTFSNLKSVTRYWFRVIAIGNGKQAVYSPPVARVVQ